ncbi:MAG: hypothetical protein LBH19_11985 [Dysgonamonadaceae bacterium]|nr:hypothetical protein [Dysgonamonadaceae bacterium]
MHKFPELSVKVTTNNYPNTPAVTAVSRGSITPGNSAFSGSADGRALITGGVTCTLSNAMFFPASGLYINRSSGML